MARDEEEQPARSFKVADRRRFVDTGADAAPVQEEATPEPPPRAATPDPGPGAAAPAAPDQAAAEAEARALGEVTFTTFVMGLTTQALMHLGEIAEPGQHEVRRDLPAAKQMIDLLAILHEKTKGNLDQAEDTLLGDMLYDLRMRYVELSRGR